MENAVTDMPAPPSARPRTWRWLRLLLRASLLFALSLAGAGLIVTTFGAQRYHWRAVELEVAIQPAMHGETRLLFAPLGEVRAATHATPMALNIGLHAISFEEMRRLIVKPPPRRALEEEFQRVARRDIGDFARRQIVLGTLGALLAPLLLRSRRLRGWLFSAASGGGFVALVFFLTLDSFDAGAFASPTYTGSLRQAPWIITLVKDGFNRVETLSDKLQNVARNLNTLYGRISALPGAQADADAIKILHISDIHNNPATVDFVRELAEKLQVDAVVDTGDLTDLGTPLETELSRGLAGLKMPYLFVAGNHDSQATAKAVRANPRAIVLQDQVVTAAGLRFLGAPDPASARPGPGSVDTPLDALDAAGQALADAYRRAEPKPDVVCVHNPRQGAPLVGAAPVLLCGHMHRIYTETHGATVVCNAGTTGAAGVRYFESRNGVPFSAALLTFARHPAPHLLFIDQVVLEGSLGQYSIRRQTFAPSASPPLPAPARTYGPPAPAPRPIFGPPQPASTGRRSPTPISSETRRGSPPGR